MLRLDRTEHAFPHEFPVRRRADVSECLREHDVAEVAIAERADVLRERLLRGAPGGLLDRLHLAPQRQPPGEPGGVREDMSQRDVVLATTAEVADELAQRHREIEDRLAHEREHERRRRELRE